MLCMYCGPKGRLSTAPAPLPHSCSPFLYPACVVLLLQFEQSLASYRKGVEIADKYLGPTHAITVRPQSCFWRQHHHFLFLLYAIHHRLAIASVHLHK